jgi:radical SAM superfamily enzyme YgiQ (UPF0313 family)
MRDRILIVKPAFSAFPVGLAYVLSCLDNNNIPFDLVDVNTCANWQGEFIRHLKSKTHMAVASGGLLGFYKFFRHLTRLVAKHSPGTPFILGGNITKDASDNLLFEYIGADYCIVGEADLALPKLARQISGAEVPDFTALPGLALKGAGGAVLKMPPARIDLCEHDLRPAWKYFDMQYYISKATLPFVGKVRIMPVLTGRGCVGRCTFCSPSIGGFRKRQLSSVIDEIDTISQTYDFDAICFYNEMFYTNKQDILDFCRAYASLPDRHPWITQLRVDSGVDHATFAAMKEAGCICVSAGIESGSDRILKLMNKRTTVAQIRNFFRAARDTGLPANGTFIVGFESETAEDIKATVDLAISETINTGGSLLYVYPGTKVYEHACAANMVKSELAHLDQATFNYNALFSPAVLEYLFNMTSMAPLDFVRTATAEVRRYNTFVFNRYPVQDIAFSVELGNEFCSATLSGRCGACGANVSCSYTMHAQLEYQGVLGPTVNNSLICPRCLQQLSYNIYRCRSFPELQSHYMELKQSLQAHKRILIAGVNNDLNVLLSVNIFDIDYSSIVGVFDPLGAYPWQHYVDIPMLRRRELVKMRPDCVLSLDPDIDQTYIAKCFPACGAPPVFTLCRGELAGTIQLYRASLFPKSSLIAWRWKIRNKLLGLYRKHRPDIHAILAKSPRCLSDWLDENTINRNIRDTR